MPMELSDALEKAQMLLERQEQLESEFKAAKKEYLHHVNSVLPVIFNEEGIETCSNKMFVFKLRKHVKAAIPEEHVDRAMDWLREHGGDHMIRRTLIAEFALGEDERAQLAREALLAMDVPMTDKQAVHWAKLSAWVKERMEVGMPVEEELLGVSAYDTVKMEKQ